MCAVCRRNDGAFSASSLLNERHKCELVHTDVDGPLTPSLGCFVYFVTLIQYSNGFITATPINSKGIVSDILKARIKQLETLTGLKVKGVRHDGAKE